MRKRGFTLIELMIVISIISIIASMGIPSYMRYTKRSKSAEVGMMLRKMFDGEVLFFHKNLEWLDSNGQPGNCGSNPSQTVVAPIAARAFALVTPYSSQGQNIPPKGKKEQIWWSEPAYDPCSYYKSPKEIDLALDSPSYYIYGVRSYNVNNIPEALVLDDAEVYAKGNLDGDTIYSEFARIMWVDKNTIEVKGSQALYSIRPLE